MASRPTVEALRQQLGHLRCQSLDKRSFLPETLLRNIFATETISQAVAELQCPPEERIGLADAIEAKGVTTFAILIWMQREDAIVDFRRRECLDNTRLSEDMAINVAPAFGQEFIREYFWQFHPHFFHIGDNLEIDERKILPFLREEHFSEGGFGLVSKVEVHPLLQNFCPGTGKPVVIIRKSLRKGQKLVEARRKALFDNEKRSLLLLNSRKHPNIVPFYGAYKYGLELCFLFPVLDMNLAEFFQLDRRVGEFQHDLTFIAALQGLSSALACVHDIRLRPDIEGVDFSGIGYHHDLRPANILVTSHTFVLADFGLGRLKPTEQGSQTRFKAGAGDYLAPECMNEDLAPQDVGRAIDVWAFGCLVAEVMTFMQNGPKGLDEFCQARLTPGTSLNWETSYFYDTRLNVKMSVLQWLDGLVAHSHSPSVDKFLRDIVVNILHPAPTRPKISETLLCLTLLSIKAHLNALLESLNKLVDQELRSESSITGMSMKIWFEQERLKAFGKVLRLDSTESDSWTAKFALLEGEKCVRTLQQHSGKVEAVREAGLLPSKLDKPKDDVQTDDVGTHSLTTAEQSHAEATTAFAADLQSSVQELWALLPMSQLRKVETTWISAMQGMDSIEELGTLGQALSSQEPAVYQESAARAMMRQIRLEMSTNTNEDAELAKVELFENDVDHTYKVQGHERAVYKKNIPVIVEWMDYDPSWKNIPPRERTISMCLKAKGFGVLPKPEMLRTLHCLGFFEASEKKRRREGYGFVYEIPRPWPTVDDIQLVTLNMLLTRSFQFRKSSKPITDPQLSRPLLGDKYRLAYLIAAFAMEFHTIGWLHENLHSNNIVFFNQFPDGQCITPDNSKTLTEPHFLGLHRCRPSGERWHTQGPISGTDFRDYQHPAYEVTRHFRYGYDYYTLGLVLLEVGLWTPLAAWVSKFAGRNTQQLRGILTTTYVPRLGPAMGSVYRDVVGKLLTDQLDTDPMRRRPDPTNEHKVFARFIEEVLDPLAALSDMSM